MQQMIQRFKDQKKIHKKYAFMVRKKKTIDDLPSLLTHCVAKIILAVRKIMMEAPSLIDLTVPKDGKLTVCGDVHGKKKICKNI